MISLLDGFLGYNQVLVAPQGHLKTTFRTKWGTYAYNKVFFGLINIGTTFQWEMGIYIRGLINKQVVVYLDDVTIFLKNREDHMIHVLQIFNICKK